MGRKKGPFTSLTVVGGYLLFLGGGFLLDPAGGVLPSGGAAPEAGKAPALGMDFRQAWAASAELSLSYFIEYFRSFLVIIPCAFVLIGLFEVWVNRETVERHLGEDSGSRGFFWAFVLGGITVGTMVAALPISLALRRKGARLEVLFTYLGAAAVCRIPMTLFEASFLGVPFTAVRYAVSLPLIVLSSFLLARLVRGRGVFSE